MMRGSGYFVLLAFSVSIACNGQEEPGSRSNSTSAPHLVMSDLHDKFHSRIETTVIAEDPVHTAAMFAGKVEYGEDDYSRVSSPVQGRVLGVKVRVGDRVQTGDVLLMIDSSDVAQAYAEFIKEDSELSYATRTYQLAQDLYETKALSLKDLKQAENALVKAQAEFRRAKEHLLSLRITEAEINKPTFEQQISSEYKLKSPMTGTVVERAVTPGQSVGAERGQVLLTIANLDTLQIVADVYERDLAAVRQGLTATVTTEAYPDETFPAVVDMIGDIVDLHTRTIKIRAIIKNDHRKLKPGMFVRLHVKIDHGRSVISVPREAVFVIDGKEYVLIMDDHGRYVKRAVKLSPASGDVVRVLEGLIPGERIVTKGAVLLLNQGQRSSSMS